MEHYIVSMAATGKSDAACSVMSQLIIMRLKDQFTDWARQEGVLDDLDRSAIAGDDPPLVLRAFLAGALAMASGKPCDDRYCDQSAHGFQAGWVNR